MLIPIKPLSVNQAFKGRRFKSDLYKQYEKDLMLLLPKMNIDNKKKLSVVIDVGISSSSDIDNVAKPFIDVLQKKYGFNDKNIEQLHMFKNWAKSGKEFINFEINYLDDN